MINIFVEVLYISKVAQSHNTHWRYAIVAVRILRTLIRRDEPLIPEQIRCFLSKTYDSHPTMVRSFYHISMSSN